MSKTQINIPTDGNLSVETKILVVDDTIVNLNLLLDILDMHGYQVRAAINGRQALLRARNYTPDLILLDIIMPGMDGYEVCTQLKADERTRDIPVIFISALNEALDKVKAFSVGGVDYLSKPFQIEEVLARVETHLTLRNLQKSLQDKNTKLEQEIIRRKEAEQLLAEYNHTLEQRVHERTTELAQATREAQEARLAAEAANEAKNLFLAKVSHELRTPLNAILGFAQVMTRSQTLPHEHEENLDIINRNGQHLLTLINRILDFSQLEAGRMVLDETNFDLYGLLEELEERFQFKSNQKHLEFAVIRDGTLPQYVRTDLVKLRQVLMNLVDNAIKFTFEGGVWLQVEAISKNTTNSLDKCIGEEAILQFEVQDMGPGIAGDELERIFSAFVQSKVGAQKEKGTGLGLSISRQFVRLMGGEISVTSQVGHGTTFNFYIPVRLVSVDTIKKRLPTRRVIALEPNQPLYRILIVDDQWHNYEVLLNLLQPVGFSLHSASNGREAIEVWQEWQPHLIWMKMRMPVMGGDEATKRIKSIYAEQATAIIALALEEERDIALSAGCDDFLPRPFDKSDIFDMIHKHLGVRYIYDKPTSSRSPVAQPEALTAGALVTLPASLLGSLQEAVEGSDIEQMEQVLAQISRHNPALANQLTTKADEFEYDDILDLIEEAYGL